MYVCYHHHKHVVVVSGLEQWRHFALICREDPLDSVAYSCAAYTTNVMLCGREIVQILNLIAELRSIILQFCQRSRAGYKLAEVIVSLAAGSL